MSYDTFLQLGDSCLSNGTIFSPTESLAIFALFGVALGWSGGETAPLLMSYVTDLLAWPTTLPYE